MKNAYNAYEIMNDVNLYSIKDLKNVHGIMSYLTVLDSGEFRKGNEVVFDGEKCAFNGKKSIFTSYYILLIYM